ncbi:hypothetical protein CFK40_07110 [Virgibacillus necropolis]|uniref:Sin domain-containing protein n=1 Tax=Virgibacillus necropolis TaxID=163877 RepID=A0A221MAV3_9BACI|nr:hypothetical protein CFK40_07110 [Virgibacillus necropolis]
MKGKLGNSLDEEWIDLLKTAKFIGLTSVEVREFISENQKFRNQEIYLQFVQNKRGKLVDNNTL